MNNQKGIVQGIDRPNRRVICQSGGARIDAAYYGDPPWPLAWVRLIEVAGGTWECLGPIGHRERLLHDHFTRVQSAGDGVGDTPWRIHGTLLFSPAQGALLDTVVGGNGVVGLWSNNVNGSYGGITKDEDGLTLATDDVIWFSARVLFTTDTLQGIIIGLMNDTVWDFSAAAAGDAGCYAEYFPASFSDFYFVNHKNTNVNFGFNEGEDIVTYKWYDLDIMLNPGVWSAFWVNGNGPMVQNDATYIPGPGLPGLQPAVSLVPSEAQIKKVYVDYIHVDKVFDVADPIRQLKTGRSATS